MLVPPGCEASCPLTWRPKTAGPFSQTASYLLNEQHSLNLSLTGQASTINLELSTDKLEFDF
jgi:hypothetical protein